MRASDSLRAQLKKAETRLATAEMVRNHLLAKLTAIAEHRPNPQESIRDRIERFLRLYSPRELAAAVNGSDDAVKRALACLVVDGFLIKTGRGAYAIDPHHGPSV